MVAIGFLRISTNPRIYPQPLPPDVAIGQLDAWFARDIVSIILEAPGHWRVLRELVAESGAAGNLAADAHLAALAITRGATLVSCDTDFARFRNLRWESPLRNAR